jgi:hypothetical protein
MRAPCCLPCCGLPMALPVRPAKRKRTVTPAHLVPCPGRAGRCGSRVWRAGPPNGHAAAMCAVVPR